MKIPLAAPRAQHSRFPHRLRFGGQGRRAASCALAAALFGASFAAPAALAATASVRGGVQFHADEAAFDAALGVPPNLTTETFDGGSPVGPFPTLCGEPMGSTSNDVCFAPGQLASGFAITSTSGNGIIEFPPAFLGPNQATRAVGATTFVDATIVTLDPPVDAVAADVYGGLSGGTAVDIEVFDADGVSLGSTTVTPVGTRDNAAFFGATSAVPIGKVVFRAQADGGELIDDLRFRAAGVLAPPGLALAFVPAAVAAGSPSTLTITLGNQSQPGVATLTADLDDALPTGLVVAGAASSTCIGAAPTASGTHVILPAGAQIPAAGTCSVSVAVSGAVPGTYTNSLGAGALQTDLGANAGSVGATLLVMSADGGAFPPAEDFDGSAPPALPSGWISSGGSGADWRTVSDVADSAPVSVHAPERAFVADFTLDTPVFTPVAHQNVSFRQRYNLERRFDGAVLEISIDGGSYVDIVDAGGRFASGGYGTTLNDGSNNPIGGRPAWSGDSHGWMTTVASLPAAATGHATRLRFRTADDASFAADGDNGWWIDSVALGVDAVPPSASVAPAALSLQVEEGASASGSVVLSNAAGSAPLVFSIETRGAAHATLVPHARTKLGAGKPTHARVPATIAAHALARVSRAASPWLPSDAFTLELDDGSAETALGAGSAAGEQAAVYLNRYVASNAMTIHSIGVYWPSGDGDLTGLQANLVAYYDADGDGDPRNALRLGVDTLVPIASTGTFETYAVDFEVPAAGDVYLGFADQWALAGNFLPRLFPAALDESASQGRSYISSASVPPVDLSNLGNNDITGTVADIEEGALDGNFMIRAVATGGGSGGPCSGQVVPWLAANAAAASLDGGASTTIAIVADASIGALAEGEYHAEVCLVTNDPLQAVLAIPVTLVVGHPPAAACSGGSDTLFCDGFESSANPDIVAGTIGAAVADSVDGSAFDFATADFHGYDANMTSDDVNLYDLVGGPDGDGLYVYWYGDVAPPAFEALVGGVVDGDGEFAVLYAGDTVGPATPVSGASRRLGRWVGGADGYLGIACYDEASGRLNYGYLHLVTGAPNGFPAQVLDWAYDRSGAAITIP
ncbi:MAG: hypothetical protein ACTHK2_00650 [Dokdonella sp.]|uniref:DUF7933 domain-containing protein n=1 Tax=Dokdonella sp. TaxID=2291710 RepID=UPI003F7E0855